MNERKEHHRRIRLFQAITALILIAIAYAMTIIGRGHTIYLDNKRLEYEGQSYSAPYRVVISVDGEEVAKLFNRERGSAICIGQTFTMTMSVLEKRGGEEKTETYTLKLPKDMDGIIINLPGYLAGLGEEAYLSEFIPAPSTEPVEETPNTEDDFGIGI